MKVLTSVLLLITGLFLMSCNSENEQQKQLDYSTVPLLQIKKEFSITESEEYLPAQLTRLFVTNNGSILISQRGEKSVHQFDSLGNYVTKVTGSGRGPGELSRNANAHFKGNILYMSNNHGFISEFHQNEHGIYEHVIDHTFRLPGTLSGIKSSDGFHEFYVSVDSIDYPFREIPPEFTTDFVHLVKVEGDSLNVTEEILSLRRHSSYIELTDGGNTMSYSSLPYRYSDYITPLTDGKIMVSRASKSAIQIYDKNLEQEHELVLNVKDRPVTDTDMAFHFPENSRTEKRDRRALIRDVKPPFSSVKIDGKDRFWLQTDETEKGKEYVVITYEGKPLGRFYIPWNSELRDIRNGKIYLIHDAWGTPSIDIYSVNL